MKKISVIMAVHNGQPYLIDAIDSILKQTWKNIEFIIVDDASSDETSKIISSYEDKRIRYIRNLKHHGLTSSLNIAIALATGEYIARMDADDIALPNKLAIQEKILEDNPQIAMVGSGAELIDKKGLKIGVRRYPESYEAIIKEIVKYNPFIHPSVIIKKNVLDDIGYYDKSLDGAEDYDLFLRISKKHAVRNLPDILLRYRISKENISWRKIKKIEAASLRTRIKAISNYGYPKWQIIYLIKPILAFMVPAKIKQFFLSHIYRI